MLYPEKECGRFDGFGGSFLCADRFLRAQEFPLDAAGASARQRLRRDCPAEPGVYGMVDAEDRLIYVGKSKCLRDRLSSYLSVGADLKARHIIAQAKRLLWEPAPHEFAALLRELELIRRWCPRFNVRGRPGRIRRGYVALGGDPAPRAYVTERPSRRDRLLVGPLRPTRVLRQMVRMVNDCFQLRDCPDKTPVFFGDQQELFPGDPAPRCLRRDFGTCLGPCARGCTRRQYAARVQAARDFLTSGNTGVLDELERAMRSAAAREDFEHAAALRDLWQGLRELHEQLERLKTVRREYSFVYPLPSYGGRESWHLVHRGQVMAVVDAPRNRRTAREAMAAMTRV
ncbi:MAG: UvrB/UvrC motif-containing protein, partial [Thermoguttaceae bacterium]|nr:UvrB/UvrC motif-containing protein [Thermoguttaceae bacterium]